GDTGGHAGELAPPERREVARRGHPRPPGRTGDRPGGVPRLRKLGRALRGLRSGHPWRGVGVPAPAVRVLRRLVAPAPRGAELARRTFVTIRCSSGLRLLRTRTDHDRSRGRGIAAVAVRLLSSGDGATQGQRSGTTA